MDVTEGKERMASQNFPTMPQNQMYLVFQPPLAVLVLSAKGWQRVKSALYICVSSGLSAILM